MKRSSYDGEEDNGKKPDRSVSQHSRLHARTQARTIPTQQWESKLLLWLMQCPLQRIEDLVCGLGKEATEPIIRRVMQDLVDRGLVELVTPSLSKRNEWYYLSNRGVYAAASQEGEDPIKMARAWGSDERSLMALLPRFHMLITLQNIVNDLATLAPSDFSHLNMRPVVEGTQARIKWRWVRDYEVEFHGKQRKIGHCEADAAVVLRRRAGELLRDQFPEEEIYTLFVFMDLGTIGFTDSSTMHEKMRSLLLYRESEEWRPYHRMFPLVMVLVGSARQKALWQQAADAAAKSLHLLMPLPAIIVDLAAERLFIEERYTSRPPEEKNFDRDQYDKVWAYDWRHLITDEPCTLRDILLPVTEEAIPPGIMPDLVDVGIVEHTKRQTLVRGCYMERLKEMLEDQKSLKEQEIALLLGMWISPRFRNVLLAIYANPLVSIDELSLFLQLSPPTAKRYIYTLRGWGCVQSVELESKSVTLSQGKEGDETKKELRWKLSERGLRYLAASERVSCAKVMKTFWAKEERHGASEAKGGKVGKTGHKGSLDTPSDVSQVLSLSESDEDSIREKKESLGKWQPGVYILQKNLQHTAGVYRLVAAFYQAAAKCPKLVLAWFETGIRCSRRYQSKEGPDKQETWHNFRPDANFSYRVEDDKNGVTRCFIAWLEWDEGTMTTAGLKEKMGTYVHYMRSRGWRREGNGMLPLLVIVVPDRSQFDRMTRVAQDELGDLDLRVCITMRDLLEEHGLLGEIWSLAVPFPLERQTKLRAFLEIMNDGGA